MQETPHDTPPTTTPPRRRWRWRLALPVLLLAGLIGALAWLTGSEAGFVRLVSWLPALSGQTLRAEAVQGTLWRGFTLRGLRYDGNSSAADIDSLSVDWQPSALWRRELRIDTLRIGHVRLESHAPRVPEPPPTPPRAPDSLGLPLKIDVAQLTLASLKLPGDGPQFYALRASYQYDGAAHRLALPALTLPWGQVAGEARLEAGHPFKLQGRLAGQGQVEGRALTAALTLGGDLLQPQFSAEASGPRLTLDAKGGLQPFAANPYQRFTRLDLRLAGINPAALHPGWPQARISLAVFAEPDAGAQIKGGLSLLNADAGALSAGKLPLSLLSGEFRGDEQALTLSGFDARVAGGRVGLAGDLQPKAMRLALDLAGVRLRELHAAAPDDALDGRITLDGPPASPKVEASLKGKLLQAQASMDFDRGADPALLLQKLTLSAGAGQMQLQGRLGLAGKQPFTLAGKLDHADPSRLGKALPAGDINAALEARGQLAAPLALNAALRLAPSRLSGGPLSGTARVELNDKRLKALAADLNLAGNRLQANGAYGQPGDKLRWQVDAPNLALIGPGFAGAVRGQGELSGTPAAPLLDARLNADNLRLPGGAAVQTLRFVGNVKADANAPFQLDLDAAGLSAGGVAAETLRANAAGTRARHTLRVDGRVKWREHPYRLQLAASGGQAGPAKPWSGTLQQLELTGKPGLSLLSPLALELSPERIRAGSARFALLGGRLDLAGFSRDTGGAMVSSGSASHLSLAELAPLLPLPLEQDLSLDADWDVNLGARASGQLQLRRAGGDVRLPGGQGRVDALGLKQAELMLTWAGNSLNGRLRLDSRYARVSGQGSLPWNGGAIDGQTPLAASLHLDAPSLAELAGLSGPSLELAGRLAADVELSGPLAEPQAQGRIVGEKLLFADHRTGLKLADGALAARLQGRTLLLDGLRFKGGEGYVGASGSIDLDKALPDVRVRVALDKFSVFERVGRRLVVSGNTDVAFVDGKLAVSGKIRADQGRIGLPKLGAPSLSADVEVLGRPQPEPSAFSKLPITASLQLDLGDNFHFSGQGLNVELAGAVTVSANPGEAPAARGQVRVVKGRYKAYGQDLDIERGVITFNGPLDNPLLNVLAKRRLSPVGAGVEVGGSVSSPQVRLVTDEPMADKDKLAWLVLGRAAGGERDDSALAASAGLMLAGSVNDHLGGLFDDLGMSSKEEKTLANGTVSPAEQVVTVGRQLTRELYLGYEYGITSAEQAVKIAYQLTRGWSVVARAGSSASVESRYTLRFD